jgi:hypothetical protein
MASLNWRVWNPQDGACLHECKIINLPTKGPSSLIGSMGALQDPNY